MAIERISGPDDPRIDDYRSVSERELVRARGLFIAEGRLVVRRLIEERRYALRSLLVNEAGLRSLEPSLAAIGPETPIFVCAPGDFLGITGFDLHRGCLALAERPSPERLDPILVRARALVILEGVTNADNVGGVFRNAAAFGVDAVLLSPTCCDPLYRKAIRTSMAATLRVPFATMTDWPSALARVRASGYDILALTPREHSEDLEVFLARARPEKLALLIGSEADGLTPAAEALSDYRVRIPIRPEIDSLNLAVAAGIAMHRLLAS